MTEIEQELQNLEDLRRGMIAKLKTKLRELDSERNQLRNQIIKLEGKDGRGAAPAPRKVRSQLGNLVINIVREAGTEGLSAGETVDAVLEEEAGTERGTVLTHLSRMVGRGMLVRTGDTGFYQYIAVEHATGVTAPTPPAEPAEPAAEEAAAS